MDERWPYAIYSKYEAAEEKDLDFAIAVTFNDLECILI